MSIDSLCDVVLDVERTSDDFHQLLKRLRTTPKECIPFKSKIIQHLRLHGLENPNMDITLVASCFARATVLFRKTPNKSEGPVGAWKSGLATEMLIIEDSINALYKEAGMESRKVIVRSEKNLEEESIGSYEDIINGHLLKINLSAHNICALISIDTDYDLPIPVQILLKLAAKIGLLRRRDFTKNPDSLIRNFVYSLSPQLINISLMLFRSLITVLGTNILPSMPFINHTILSLLAWTRTSSLSSYQNEIYHYLRLLTFQFLTFSLKRLSLNVNFESKQLKTLVEDELLVNLEQLSCYPMETSQHQHNHMLESMVCLENLIMIYSDHMEAKLESRIRNYIIQECFKIYRDFNESQTSGIYRRRLLELVLVIANQPYASSSTEIAYHIFELAERLDSDPETRDMARKSLRFGLAHRPTIVTSHEVYKSYGSSAHRPTVTALHALNQSYESAHEPTAISSQESEKEKEKEREGEKESEVEVEVEEVDQSAESVSRPAIVTEPEEKVDQSKESKELDRPAVVAVPPEEVNQRRGESEMMAHRPTNVDHDDDEAQINEFLQLFVDEPPNDAPN